MKSLLMGLPLDLGLRTKGQLAIDICAAAYADGIRFDFACGDEVYGNCTQLREFFDASGQAYVLRVPPDFTLALAAGTTLTCAEAVSPLLKDKRRWKVRSIGSGSQTRRTLVRLGLDRHRIGAPPLAHPPPPQDRGTGLLLLLGARRADPDQGPADPRAGLRWTVEDDFELGEDCFGLDQCHARLYTAIARHAVLVMAALAICAVTSALLRPHRHPRTAPRSGPISRRPPSPA